jgi:hypothetical protein
VTSLLTIKGFSLFSIFFNELITHYVKETYNITKCLSCSLSQCSVACGPTATYQVLLSILSCEFKPLQEWRVPEEMEISRHSSKN